jgi:hypothetical protein
MPHWKFFEWRCNDVSMYALYRWQLLCNDGIVGGFWIVSHWKFFEWRCNDVSVYALYRWKLLCNDGIVGGFWIVRHWKFFEWRCNDVSVYTLYRRKLLRNDGIVDCYRSMCSGNVFTCWSDKLYNVSDWKFLRSWIDKCDAMHG